MKDVDSLIYDELVALRKDLRDYMKDTDGRILTLEKFKEKAMGVCIAIGVGAKCAWDYIAERMI